MMAPICPKPSYFIFTLIAIAIFCSYSGHAEEDPSQAVARALLCFNNKFIYMGCAGAYRLKQNGDMNVPSGAIDEFCNGPCLAETQVLLSCIDNIISSFVFDNKAAVPNIRDALHAGCSYTSQRGNFNVENYVQGETSNSYGLANSISICAFGVHNHGRVLLLALVQFLGLSLLIDGV